MNGFSISFLYFEFSKSIEKAVVSGKGLSRANFLFVDCTCLKFSQMLSEFYIKIKINSLQVCLQKSCFLF